MVRTIVLLLIAVLPQALKQAVYRRAFGYRIGRGVRIGVSLLDGRDVEIGDAVTIGHLNRFRQLTIVKIGDHASIGHGNIFVASSEFTDPRSLAHRGNRPALLIGRHVGIAASHHFDVNDTLTIGEFSVFAGKGSQVFSHYVDVRQSSTSTKPVTVGRYCMLGSAVRLVPGAVVPDYCVVGMGAVVTKRWTESYRVLGGNPASVIGVLPPDAPYFTRTTGWIGRFSESPHHVDKR